MADSSGFMQVMYDEEIKKETSGWSSFLNVLYSNQGPKSFVDPKSLETLFKKRILDSVFLFFQGFSDL